MTAPCNAAGELTNRTLENGVSTGYAYDVAGQLTSMAQTLNNVPFDTLGCTLDNRGRRTGIARAGGKNDGYSYDAIGEVVGGAYAATASGNQTEGFGYDAAGNRLSSAKNGYVTAYTANTLDQYMSVAGETQTYDANGNNTQAVIPGSASAMAIQWDSENRLLTTQSATAKSENGYDPLQRRVWKKVYAPNGSGGWNLAKTVVFTYDRWNVIMEKEYGSAGTLARTLRYTWGADVSGNLQGAGGVGGLLMAEEINGATATPHYYCYDGNGNVTQVVDAAGSIEASHRYTAFGGNLESVTTTAFAQRNPWRFSTKYLDQEVETTDGFYYYGYRFYLTALGKWLSEDPIGESGGPNLYGYVGNGPIGAWDPLGLDINWVYGADKFNTTKAQSGSGFFDVDGHGSLDSFGWKDPVPKEYQDPITKKTYYAQKYHEVSAKDLAAFILKQKDYNPGDTVRLNACNTGAKASSGMKNYAQMLATELARQSGRKTEVYAPPAFVRVKADGSGWEAGEFADDSRGQQRLVKSVEYILALKGFR
ncbi:hypothetical protein BH11VER1_BH11VER1_35700 [soil metagenome]